MIQFQDEVGIDLPYDRPAQKDKCRRVAALMLTDINDNNLVVTMDYILGVTIWVEFMSLFVQEVESNRELGFVKLRVLHLNDTFVSWVFRKLDVHLIAAIVGGVLHELADRYYSNTRKYRWLESADLTWYTESYRDLLGEQKIVGAKLSEQAFKKASLDVFENKTDPSKWRCSFGITALMISESARFVPFKNALAENIANGTEMLLAAEGKGKYDWAAAMPNHWADFSSCARRFVHPDEEVLNNLQSMSGVFECLENPTAAYRALSLKCYHKHLDVPKGAVGGPGGPGGGPRGSGGGPRVPGGGQVEHRGGQGERGGGRAERGGGRAEHRGGREASQTGGRRRGRVAHGVNVSDTNNANMATLCFERADQVNSQLISNVCTYALSAEKYYYFIWLMGRKASHVAVECTLQSHPNMIETKKLLAELVEAEINMRLKEGTYKGKKFNGICRCHFFGYQARGSLPSEFDSDYAYILGDCSYHILAAGLNGYMATVTNLKSPLNEWPCGAAPMTAMMTVKHYGRGSGPGTTTIGKPVVHPATVSLRGKVYELLRQNATKILLDDVYGNPSPLLFEGPGADSKAVSLCVENLDHMGRIEELNDYLDKKRTIMKPGCSQDVLEAALSAMSSVTDILSVMTSQRLEY